MSHWQVKHESASRLQKHESRLQKHESRLQKYESRLQKYESRLQKHEISCMKHFLESLSCVCNLCKCFTKVKDFHESLSWKSSMKVQETFMKYWNCKKWYMEDRYINQWEGNLTFTCRNMVYLGKKLAQVCNLIG